jgi:endonuclease/exonuclease/phosphatase family metal-dependent hydrolase
MIESLRGREPPAFGGTLLVALAVVLGGQLVRVLFPMVGWYLRDTVGVPTLGLLPYALGPFVLAVAIPIVIRLLRPRGALLTSAGLLIGAYVVEVVSTSPEVQLWAALAGVTGFLWLLALAVTRSRSASVYGIILGLAFDTTLRGAWGTLDLSSVPGTAPMVVAFVLAGSLGVLVFGAAGAAPDRGRLEAFSWLGVPGGHTLRHAAALAAVGPLLLLHWLALHNQGWIATQTGWSWSMSLALILAADAVALAIAAIRMPAAEEGALAALAGLLLLAAAGALGQTGWLFAIASFAGIAATGPFLASVIALPDPTRPAGAATGVALGVGQIAFIIIAFAYYSGYDINLRIGQPEIRAALGVVLAIAAIASLDIPRTGTGRDLRPAILAALLLLVPAALLVVDRPPDGETGSEAGGTWPVRVMTYNLHSGYATDGTRSLWEIAEVIEDADVDVVAVQEITRGWLLDGSTDMVGWLQRRLGMPHVTFFAATDDPLWGNAIFSRHPLELVRRGTLPRHDTLIRRGYEMVEVEFADGFVLINTHLQHAHHDGIEALTELHIAQLQTILQAWRDRPRTVLVGDLNAEPDAPQIGTIDDAGFLDSWAQAGEGAGHTFPADGPERRIDWILHTGDLETVEVDVIDTRASDHRPVVATITGEAAR